MNYLNNVFSQLQRQKMVGQDPMPRWNSNGTNSQYYEARWAQDMADKQFDQDRQMRELDILEGAFRMPQRNTQYQRTQFQPQPQGMPGIGSIGASSQSYGRREVPGLENYLARLMGQGSMGGGMKMGG